MHTTLASSEGCRLIQSLKPHFITKLLGQLVGHIQGSIAVVLEQGDVKDKRRIGGDVRCRAPLPISKLGRDGQPALLPGPHANDPNVPTLDHIAAADLKTERLGGIKCGFGVKHTSYMMKIM